MRKNIFLALLFAVIYLQNYSQTYPSGITTTLFGPHSIFLDEYADPLNPKIRASILFTDFTEPSWDAYLKLKITGPNFTIETKPGIKPPQAINMIPGIPSQISGADLSWYFNNDNLNFSGITRAQLEANNNRLPEGLYTFCFEVLDYQTDKKLSLPGCAAAYLALNDPPIVLAPNCGSAIENIAQQNILFQWQISNTNGNLNVASLNYQIDLYEVNNNYSNPQNAIINNQALPIWQSQPIAQNSYLYGISEPPLEKGKRYVFTVKAIEQGKSQIKNNGYSQACWFYYGYPEGGSINLISLQDNTQLGLNDNGYFTWDRPSNVINTSQMVAYHFTIAPLQQGQDRETAILNNTPFHYEYLMPSTSQPKNFALPVSKMMQLQKMGEYVWQVKAVSGQQEIAQSAIYKFTGPPVIEKFYAGGFVVNITQLTQYDSLTHKISGKGKVILNSAGEAPEFEYNNIYLSAIGNNEWVMSSGEIHDNIIVNPYTLNADSVSSNGTSSFNVDSIHINTQSLFLSGFASWRFPLGVNGNNIPYLNAAHQYLSLNNNFKLSSIDFNSFSQNYRLTLLEPGGFVMQVNSSSQILINNSNYNLLFEGFVELPSSVKDGSNSTVKIPFREAGQLFYIFQQGIPDAEGIRLIDNTSMDLKARDYILDFSETKSPGDFSADSLWKGLYMQQAGLFVPINAETSGQISASVNLNEPIFNLSTDSTKMFVDQTGLTLKTTVDYNPVNGNLLFNTFPSVENKFRLSIDANTVNESHLTGKIQIPVLDTLNGFPYFIRIDEFGFGDGYLLNGLSGYNFVFNPAGSVEQKINITLTRAVFKNHNRLEMDMNLSWPHFNLSLNQLEKFCAWGNGNIGFETPNGILPLTYQATGLASGYEIQVDRVGCGRAANLYSFGISSRIVMADDIAGEDGAPIANSYSMYKNPLLSGDYTQLAFTMGNDSAQVDSNGVNSNVSNDMNTNIEQTLNDLGINASGNRDSSAYTGGGSDNNNAILPNSVYMDMQKVVTIAKAFVVFLDSSKQPKAQDYITVVEQILNSDEVKRLVNTSPEQLVNDLIMDAAECIIKKINQPIVNLSNKATTKIRSVINDNVVTPVTSKIDTLIYKALDKIRDQLVTALGEENQSVKDAVIFTVNTVKTNLATEIRNAIKNSVETNVTSKLTGFIEVGITGKITGYVNKEIKNIATNIIDNGINNSVNLNNIINNAEVLFKDIGDTIVDAITSININSIKNTIENIGDDIVTNVSFERIGENILNELASKGLSAAVTGIIQNQLGNLGGAGGGAAAAILSTVKFDFSNLGEKIQNGQLDQIVKFDPTNIYITTNAADVSGQLKFTKDDPIYGDSWQAFVKVVVKVPKKENPVTGSLKFINGKTTQLAQNFSYWFFSGQLLGLNIPLGSLPFTIDGFDGTVYHHMKKMSVPQPVPDNSVNYGVRAGMYLFDTQTKGKIIKFDVGLGVEFGGGDFAIQLDGKADVGNYNNFSIATATGYIGYYSADRRFQGAFNVTFNTAPLLCAGGEMGVKVDGINHTWEVYIGKRATPVEAKLLCKDNLKSGGYFDMNQSGIQAGFFLNVAVDAETPWIGGDNLRVRGWANFGFGIDAYANVSFEPSFKINDAYISVWASAGIGFDYETPVKSGSLTIAGVSLSGSLLYKSHERSEVHGGMSGSVTILGVDIGVDMQVHYDLDNKQKISA